MVSHGATVAGPGPIVLTTEIGAAESASVDRLVFYIPSRDQDGVEFDPSPWVEEALVLLSDIGGGATAMPPVDGAWKHPKTGRLLREKIVLAYTYVDPDQFEAHIGHIREFLHRMGRQTNQGEIVCEFGTRMDKIRAYDDA
jgi:hypothetical protein